MFQVMEQAKFEFLFSVDSSHFCLTSKYLFASVVHFCSYIYPSHASVIHIHINKFLMNLLSGHIMSLNFASVSRMQNIYS